MLKINSYKYKLYILLLLGVFLAFSLVGCLQIQRLPEPQISLASKVVDANGREITTLFRENRIEVSLENVSPYFLNGIVSVEDARFYDHTGIDVIGIGRAAYRNLRARRVVEGGSTITQQTVKNLYLTHERTFDRKIRELLLTIQLERSYTKKEILNLYVNQIYFGKGAYGVEVASQTYFGKPAKDLNLAEGAMLAGIPRGPNLYNPFNNFTAAKNRQEVVLNRMVELGFVSSEEAEKAKAEEINLRTSEKLETQRASFFIEEIRKYITSQYPDGAELLYRGGLTIETTLDLEMQEAAERAIRDGLAENAELQAALVAIDPKTGYVKAMVGGRDDTSKWNRATEARRQPGSAMKPFLFAAAIDNGYTAANTFTCEPVEFNFPNQKPWRPTDYGQSYHNRDFTLKEALQVSDNVVSAKLITEVGPETMARYGNNMGIDSKLNPVPSLSLGTSVVKPLELTVAYGPLANQGIKAQPLFIVRITDSNGRVLEENRPFLSKVLDERTSYIVTDMLKAVVQPGGTAARVGASFARPMAGKTGTTDNFRDAWYVGYTPDLVTTVWVGYDDQKRSVGRTGGAIAAPIWIEFNKVALEKITPRDFQIPDGIVKANICADTGLLATSRSEKVLEMAFISGTEPTESCPNHPELRWWERPFTEDGEEEDDLDEDESPEQGRRNNWNPLDWFFR